MTMEKNMLATINEAKFIQVFPLSKVDKIFLQLEKHHQSWKLSCRVDELKEILQEAIKKKL